MKNYKKLLLVLIVLGILATPLAVQAIAPIVPDCAREQAKTQTPGLECIVAAMINVAKLILGISGSVALALFIYGGFLMLVSGGNEQLVTKGKSVLSGAVIGLIIVFGAYTGVFFLVRTMTSGNGDLGKVLQCININIGEYCPDGSSCGAEDDDPNPCSGGTGGACQSGICVSAQADQVVNCVAVSTDAQGSCKTKCVPKPTGGECPTDAPSTLDGACATIRDCTP